MTKATMIKNYKCFSVAEAYIIGFVYDGQVYMLETSNIRPSFLNVETASRNQGLNLRFRLKKAQKESLMKKNPVCLGSASILESGKYNKGENFERAVTEYFNQTWKKDTIPFYVDGDITVNNKKIQIKFDGATLTNTKQIKKLKGER